MAEPTSDQARPRRLAVDTQVGAVSPLPAAPPPVPAPLPPQKVSVLGRTGRALDYATLFVPLLLQCGLAALVTAQFYQLRHFAASSVPKEEVLKLIDEHKSFHKALLEQLKAARDPRAGDTELTKILVSMAKKIDSQQGSPELAASFRDLAGQLAKLNESLARRPSTAAEEVLLCYCGKEPWYDALYERKKDEMTAELIRALHLKTKASRLGTENDVRQVLEKGHAKDPPAKGSGWRCVILADATVPPPRDPLRFDPYLSSCAVVLLNSPGQPTANVTFAKDWLQFCERHGATFQAAQLDSNADRAAQQIVQRVLARPTP